MKRIIDIIGSICGICFLVVVAPFVALAIVLESGRPVFVKLPRVSRGKIIQVYKFRSMVNGAEKMKENVRHLNERNDGPLFKAANDPRITKVGRWLRKTRLDEFPQMANVLKGELSLVGPRPHEPDEMLAYPPEYWRLFMVKGGLTGLAQISGGAYLPFRKELELDSYYAEHSSFWLDMKIIAKTIWIFLFDHRGI